jgi:hypothetical protein
VKVINPTALVREAAEVLDDLREDVVLVGAAALQVALAESASRLTPTRDVDLVVSTQSVDGVIARLTELQFDESQTAHERGFTWVRGDLKVQLIRSFHPLPGPSARRLPENARLSVAERPDNQDIVAFADRPEKARLVCANPACLVALKYAAFGRTRPPDDTPVRRDYHDVYLLVAEAGDEVLRGYEEGEGDLRAAVRSAVESLSREGEPLRFAASEMVGLQHADSASEAEAIIRGAAVRFGRRLET